MPPLLPEYLVQPMISVLQSLPESTQIVVKSMPTDWDSILFSAAATLLGSFGGAVVGGLVAYKGTIKANGNIIKRQKLEEVLTELLSIKECLGGLTSIMLKSDGMILTPAKIEEIKDLTQELCTSRSLRFEALLHIYANDLKNNLLEFKSLQISLNVSVYGHNFKQKKRDLIFSKIALFESKLEYFEIEIIKRLQSL